MEYTWFHSTHSQSLSVDSQTQAILIYGNGALDLLQTYYTKLSENSGVLLTASQIAEDVVSTLQTQLDYLRPHAELTLGLGWGTYLFCNKWHMDCSIDYGFQVFWNQNMFRQYFVSNSPGAATSCEPYGDLFVQGLTATFRLDF